MVTLHVHGEKAEGLTKPEALMPELTANPQAEDVVAFSRSKGLDGYLQKAVSLARQVFAPIERIEMELRPDPATDDEWIVLRVVVHGDRVDVSAARKEFTAQWVASVPAPERFLIRLSPDIL